MPMNDKTPQWRHQVTLVDREEMSVEGVIALGSADEQEVVMETERGPLVVKGEGLNIQQLNLDKGNIVIDGLIKSLVYDDEPKQKKGLLNRLLK